MIPSHYNNLMLQHSRVTIQTNVISVLFQIRFVMNIQCRVSFSAEVLLCYIENGPQCVVHFASGIGHHVQFVRLAVVNY